MRQLDHSTPATTFSNASGAGSFNLGTITLSGLADACSGKIFTVRAYGDTGNALTISAGGATTTGLVFTPTLAASPSVSVQSGANQTIATPTYSLDNSSLVITVVTTLAASSIYKFTVETA